MTHWTQLGPAIVLAAMVSDPAAAASGVAVLREMEAAKQASLKTIHDLNFKLGSQVDRLIYDWNEARRQRKVDPPTWHSQRQALDQIQSRLNERYEKLIADRQTFFDHLAQSLGGNRLTIENLEDSESGSSHWFMLRWAKIRLNDQETIDLAPTDFQGGAGYQTYSYQCPPALAVWIYGRQTETWQMSARFFVDSRPAQDPSLLLSGQDSDKVEVTRIRLALNGTEVFSGPNGFVKRGWSEKEFRLPRESLIVGGAESISAKLVAYQETLAQECQEITDWGLAQLSPVEAQVRPIAQLLTYQDPPAKWDFTQHHFVRGMYYHGLMPDVPLVVKALRDAECNFILSYLTRTLQAGQSPPGALETLLQLTDGMGIAVAEAVWPEDGWPFLHPERLEEQLLAFVEPLRAAHPSLVGVEFDEPGGAAESLRNEEGYRAFAAYLRGRSSRPEELGDLGDSVTPPPTVASPRHQVLWMEWQLFAIDAMRNFFDHVESFCQERRLGLYPIIVGCPPTRPQHASFAALPAVTSTLAQGSYGSSSLSLTFLLELLRANACGRTFLCAGSGFACPTARAHERELSLALPHSDGVWVWCWIHQQRYYVHETFSKPGQWEATQRVFRKMARAEPYLVNTTSSAQTALVYSERTGIADSYGHDYGFTQPYYLNQLGWYWAMLSSHRQCDAVLAEGMTPERVSRYRVLLLADARALTPEQIDLFRDWVEAGGTLIATANTSLDDEWGREQNDYALADLFGVRYRQTGRGEKGFRLVRRVGPLRAGTAVAYNPDLPYAVVEPLVGDGPGGTAKSTGAEVLARWENGSPAATRFRYGRGRTVFLSAQQLGLCTAGKPSVTERPGPFLPGVAAFLEALVGLAVREPVQADHCPPEVEVALRLQPGRRIIHLINHGEGSPVRGVRLTLDRRAGGRGPRAGGRGPESTGPPLSESRKTKIAKLKSPIASPGERGRAFYPADGTPVRLSAADRRSLKWSVRAFTVHEMIVVEP